MANSDLFPHAELNRKVAMFLPSRCKSMVYVVSLINVARFSSKSNRSVNGWFVGRTLERITH